MSKVENINYCEFDGCKRKLKLTDFSCKCEKTFCRIHRFPENHNCIYDYKENNNKENKIDKLKCISLKIEKI